MWNLGKLQVFSAGSAPLRVPRELAVCRLDAEEGHATVGAYVASG